MGNGISNIHRSYSQDFSQELENLRIENPTNPTFGYLNINSVKNRFKNLIQIKITWILLYVSMKNIQIYK